MRLVHHLFLLGDSFLVLVYLREPNRDSRTRLHLDRGIGSLIGIRQFDTGKLGLGPTEFYLFVKLFLLLVLCDCQRRERENDRA